MPEYQRSVAGIAIEGGRLFIARRTSGGDLGGKWEFPGGKVESGESDADALIREYREEFGVTIKTGAFIGGASFEHHGRPFELNAYRIFLGVDAFSLTEHSEWRWAFLPEIESLDFVDSDRKLFPALQAYLEHNGAVKH